MIHPLALPVNRRRTERGISQIKSLKLYCLTSVLCLLHCNAYPDINILIPSGRYVLLTHYCAGDKVEKNCMGGPCSAYGGGVRRVQGFGREI
jgi:hypothetical protein